MATWFAGAPRSGRMENGRQQCRKDVKDARSDLTGSQRGHLRDMTAVSFHKCFAFCFECDARLTVKTQLVCA
jgi:hypothetical protein